MDLTMLANFIPDQWFAGFEQDRAWMLWVLCAAAIVLLSIGADRVVAAAHNTHSIHARSCSNPANH